MRVTSSDSVNLTQAVNISSRDVFAGLLEMVSDLVWSLSLNTQRIYYINPAAAQVYGRPLNELTNQPGLWLSCVHAEDRDILKANLSQLPELKNFAQEFRIVQPDGEEVWLKGRFRLVLGSDGRPAFIGATAKDVSKRVNAERQLEESQAIYHSLVESLPINVFRKDREGRIVFANKRYCEELKVSLDEIIGKTDLDLFPDMAEKYLRDDAWVLRTGLPFHDIEVHPHGPTQMYVEVLKAPVTDVNGRRIGIQGMFWDVTERKMAEKALREAKEIAESASRAKTDFLANVSHEIRTPMNGIIGITDLLMSSSNNREQREYLELIQTSAESLLTLINDILDFSKIEAGKIRLESNRFQLRDSIGDTLRSLAVRAHGKGLELIASFAPDVPDAIIGDLLRLRQIIVNLVSNAVKFTEHGQVHLEVVNLGTKDDNIVRLQFSVTDSGIGIPQDKLKLIFTEFEQADSSTTRQYGGTGLGLAIASSLVHLMGGQLDVESRPNQGSRFFFSADFHFDKLHVEESLFQDLAHHKALTVVTNPQLRANLKSTLERVGIQVYETASASDAITILQAMQETGMPLSIVLSDIDLDQEDGSVLIQKIRKQPGIAETPVILLSNAIASDLSIERAKLDIHDILIKPVKEVDLLESISIALGLLGPDTTIDEELDSRSGIVFEQLDILLAEDNRVNQKLAVALLEKIGHRVEVATNGREAVAMYRQKPFDLVLMDVQMPEVDGYQATRQIRQIQQQIGKRVPIIALTAHASPADRQRCLASGMDEYLAKPIRADDLYVLIESLTGHRSTVTGEPSEAKPATHLIDWEMAFETVGGDRKLLEELIRVFLKDQEQMLANIETSISQQDEKNLRLSAHSIKGALNHLGGRSAAKHAEKLESMAQKEDLTKAATVFDQFRDSLNELTSEMKKFVGD